MNKGTLPNYNDAIKSNSVTQSDVRWLEHGSEYQSHVYLAEVEEGRGGGLQRSDSKSSCSSGSSSQIRLSNDLPPGWELRFHSSGIYYCHLPTDTQHWNHPHEKADLPPGWERVYNAEYGEYFVNHITKTAQFQHPGPLSNPVTGEQHAQALAAVKQHKEQAHSSTYVPPSQYQSEEIPHWLQEYAASYHGDECYSWSEEEHAELDKYQTMMTRLYRQELKLCIEKYEDYRNRIIRELEERMQLHDLSQAGNHGNQATTATQNRETYV